MLTPLLWLVFLAIGAVAGFLAGLFGVGGGLIIVPLLYFFLGWQGLDAQHLMYLALGTSMASILFTSISSFWAHHQRQAVLWSVVWRIGPGILLGTFGGSFLATQMPVAVLKVFFVLFLFYVSVQMLINRKPKASRELPGPTGMITAGSVIGMVSSWVGIGGGTLSVPFMLWCNVPATKAIGTSAAIGFPIALAGALGYLVNGLGRVDLPAYSLGYIYLPALAGIVTASVLVAPLGVKLSHSLPVDILKRIFAVFLLIVGLRMLWSLVG